MGFLAGEERGQCSMGVGQGCFPGVGGEPGLEAAAGKSMSQWGVEGSGGLGLLDSLTRSLSPEQPAVHHLTLQAGGVCLQPVPQQREPQPGDSHHSHHHEPESYRLVASDGGIMWSGWGLCLIPGVIPRHTELASFCPNPRGVAQSYASSLHLFLSLERPVCCPLLTHWGTEAQSSVICCRSWDCGSQKLRFFPLTSRPTSSPTQGPSVTVMVLKMHRY